MSRNNPDFGNLSVTQIDFETKKKYGEEKRGNLTIKSHLKANDLNEVILQSKLATGQVLDFWIILTQFVYSLVRFFFITIAFGNCDFISSLVLLVRTSAPTNFRDSPFDEIA